jgi:hypothetical protein
MTMIILKKKKTKINYESQFKINEVKIKIKFF